MKRIVYLLPLLLLACNNASNQYPPAENALDAGREFIDGCLKGAFDKASFYMLPDETNKQDLEKIKRNYQTKSKSDQAQYQQASIVIENVDNVNDSITIINYKNSFDKIARKVKVIRRNNNWLVDFKYTFNGNM
jgi:hypothetical protein